MYPGSIYNSSVKYCIINIIMYLLNIYSKLQSTSITIGPRLIPVVIRHVSRGGEGKGLPPPLEIEKQKKIVIKANYLYIYIYIYIAIF